MEIELVCPICLEDFDLENFIPLILVCGHTLCKNCLQSMLTRSSIECPQDRRRDMRRFEDIPTNFLIADLIAKRMHHDSHRCKLHPRKKANFYCIIDDQKICSYCILSHKDHEVRSLIDYEEEVKFKKLHQPPKLLPLQEDLKLNSLRNQLSCQQLFFRSTVLSPDLYTPDNCNSMFPENYQKIKLRLLYRYSEDNPSNEEFHRRCDNKGYTLTIVSANGFVFGGYTEIPWKAEKRETGRYHRDDNAYLFSLSHITGMHAFKCFVRDKYRNLAVFHLESAGPTFGAGYDLHLNFDDIRKSCSKLKAYELPKPNALDANEFLQSQVENWDSEIKLNIKMLPHYLLADEFCNWALKDVEIYSIIYNNT